jgi:hypothetical protein
MGDIETRVDFLEKKVNLLTGIIEQLEKKYKSGGGKTAVLDNLNNAPLPTITFTDWWKTQLKVEEEDFTNLFESGRTVFQCVEGIIARNLTNKIDDCIYPIVSYARNTNIYIFENQWKIMENSDMGEFMRNIRNKLLQIVEVWHSKHKDDIVDNDALGKKYNNGIEKLMNINLNDMTSQRTKLREFLITNASV